MSVNLALASEHPSISGIVWLTAGYYVSRGCGGDAAASEVV